MPPGTAPRARRPRRAAAAQSEPRSTFCGGENYRAGGVGRMHRQEIRAVTAVTPRYRATATGPDQRRIRRVQRGDNSNVRAASWQLGQLERVVQEGGHLIPADRIRRTVVAAAATSGDAFGGELLDPIGEEARTRD